MGVSPYCLFTMIAKTTLRPFHRKQVAFSVISVFVEIYTRNKTLNEGNKKYKERNSVRHHLCSPNLTCRRHVRYRRSQRKAFTGQ